MAFIYWTEKPRCFVMQEFWLIGQAKKIGDKIHCTASKVDETWLSLSHLLLFNSVRIWWYLRESTIKSKSRRQIWLKSCFSGGQVKYNALYFKKTMLILMVSTINNYIELSIDFHKMIIFFENSKLQFLPTVLGISCIVSCCLGILHDHFLWKYYS